MDNCSWKLVKGCIMQVLQDLVHILHLRGLMHEQTHESKTLLMSIEAAETQ